MLPQDTADVYHPKGSFQLISGYRTKTQRPKPCIWGPLEVVGSDEKAQGIQKT